MQLEKAQQDLRSNIKNEFRGKNILFYFLFYFLPQDSVCVFICA